MKNKEKSIERKDSKFITFRIKPVLIIIVVFSLLAPNINLEKSMAFALFNNDKMVEDDNSRKDKSIMLPFGKSDEVEFVDNNQVSSVDMNKKNKIISNNLTYGFSDSSSNSVSASSITVNADFNGDGYDDLAIGVPGEDVGAIASAGAVHVIYGSSVGVSADKVLNDQFWTQNSPSVDDSAEDEDRFGSSLSSGDYNGDGRDDLAIGVPGEDFTTTQDVGVVQVLYGSSSGLSATSPLADQRWSQSTTDVADTAEEGDNFGSSLSSGDYNNDGRDDLAIGVPGEDFTPTLDVGVVNVLYGSSSGLSATSPRSDQLWSQDSSNVEEVAETDDEFGHTLSSGDYNNDGRDDLAIGVPHEGFGSNTIDVGIVQILYGSSSGLSATSPIADQLWSQDSPDVEDSAEDDDHFGNALSSGDYNGDGRDDLAIGVRYEDFDSGPRDVGIVQILYGSSSGLSATSPIADQLWSQDSPDVEDSAEQFDAFSNALSSGDYNGDGRDDLAIGTEVENLESGSEIYAAGIVQILYGSSSGLSATSPIADQLWSQDSPDVDNVSEEVDRFGYALSSGDYNNDGRDDLAIGVPGEGIDDIGYAGAVHVIYGSSLGLSATSPLADELWTQDSPKIEDTSEEFDRFGGSLS